MSFVVCADLCVLGPDYSIVLMPCQEVGHFIPWILFEAMGEGGG